MPLGISSHILCVCFAFVSPVIHTCFFTTLTNPSLVALVSSIVHSLPIKSCVFVLQRPFFICFLCQRHLRGHCPHTFFHLTKFVPLFTICPELLFRPNDHQVLHIVKTHLSRSYFVLPGDMIAPFLGHLSPKSSSCSLTEIPGSLQSAQLASLAMVNFHTFIIPSSFSVHASHPCPSFPRTKPMMLF